MKIYHWFFLLFFILFSLWKWFEYDLKTWLIEKHLATNISIVEGELIRHDEISIGKGKSRKISIVEFYVNEVRYFAETDRLKIALGIKLMVKYSIDNPKWHRVIIPDSLKKYHMPNAFFGEDRFYTWPPTEPDGKCVMKKDNYRKGPY